MPLVRAESTRSAASSEGPAPFAAGPRFKSPAGYLPYEVEYASAATLSVRSDPTAAASFAAIFERNKFGMAIAATIKMIGMIAIPKYPRTSPARAIPSPVFLPPLRRISEREMCPNMMAATAEGKMKNRSPQSRLTMASPLVAGVMGGVGSAGYAEAGEDVATEDNFAPHWGQNEGLPSGIWFPQEVQVGMPLPRLRERFLRTVLQLSNKSNLMSG